MAGQPTKYTPEVNQKVDEYLQTCGSHNLKLPQVTDFARFIGISRDTAYEWVSKHPEFSDTIKKIKDFQRIDLINNGLYASKEVSAAMAIFLLKAIHKLNEGPTILQQFNIGGEMTLEFIGPDEDTTK